MTPPFPLDPPSVTGNDLTGDVSQMPSKTTSDKLPGGATKGKPGKVNVPKGGKKRG